MTAAWLGPPFAMEEETIGSKGQLHVWEPKLPKLAKTPVTGRLSVPESGLAMHIACGFTSI
jgi:hypothetical protein